MEKTNIPSRQMLRINEVAKRAGVCRATIYNWSKYAGFPKQVRLGPKIVGWVAFEVDAWLDERINARDAVA